MSVSLCHVITALSVLTSLIVIGVNVLLGFMDLTANLQVS